MPQINTFYRTALCCVGLAAALCAIAFIILGKISDHRGAKKQPCAGEPEDLPGDLAALFFLVSCLSLVLLLSIGIAWFIESHWTY